jgi:nucleosome binding factor SPN SPT16 subunit
MSLLQPETFWQRLTLLQDELTGEANGLNDVDSIAVPIDPPSEELTFTKSSAFFIHHFGLELHGSLAIVCKGSFHVLATEKYCILLEALKKKTPPTGPEVVLHRICDDDAVTNKNLASLIETYGGGKVGRLERMQFHGALAASLDKAISSTRVESVDVTSALGVSMSVKDEYALTGFRRAAVITYKVLKHGFVRLVEDVLDQARTITHEQIATHVDECCEDPSKVNIKLPQGHYESCYFPIVQSGGDYDIRPSASTNSEVLSDDVIIVSLGVRYNFHCATMSRTLFIDPVPTIENNYAILLELQRACLAAMLAGRSLGSVAERGIGLIRQKYPHLLKFLPKSFGFGLGLDFREPSMILSSKNQRQFAANMVFNLAVGFHDLELTNIHKEGAQGSVRNLSKYSMLIADTVVIRANEQPPDVLTKHSVEWKDVSYFINEKNDSENPSDEGKTKRPEKAESAVLNSRLRERANNGDAERSNSARNEKQAELMRHKIAAKRTENRDSWSQQGQSSHTNVAEVNTYHSTREYPGDVPASEIFVDMQAQTLFAPVNGAQVPFHISMVKTVVQPDPDRAATYLRLNFFTPGQALPKDVAPATTKLIEQHGQSSVLIKEMLYRSRESQRLTAAYRMIQELRKRFRQHAAKAAEEADLVPQEKLVKMRDQRIPRMADLTMRPFISGKKTMGTLEAHTNGLRFTSKKHEILDVMFTNIKHSLFQVRKVS